jgi:hypothetical protein
VLTYLPAENLRVGLLIHFNAEKIIKKDYGELYDKRSQSGDNEKQY